MGIPKPAAGVRNAARRITERTREARGGGGHRYVDQKSGAIGANQVNHACQEKNEEDQENMSRRNSSQDVEIVNIHTVLDS